MSLGITEKLPFLSRQMWYWWKMLTGRSYYHKIQKIGKLFVPNELKGYFNDLTGKIHWTGEVDSDGVPVNTLSDGRKFQFPILITQKALGHYDQWLLEKDDKNRLQFLTLCHWLLEYQDEKGGWDTWQTLFGPKYQKYSAMTQGQALSVLSRALKLTNDSRFQQTAEKAFNLFLIDVKEGGVTYFEEKGIFLEELPLQIRNTVLNGWIFALFGLYDYNLIVNETKVRDMFEQSIDTLAQHLADYDCGYWSYYNSKKSISSPFYHRLHISQLEALRLISQNPTFKEYLQRWTNFQNKFINKSLAFVLKAFQKLKEPARITLIK
jgi:heparosan-N-sulfate-glucuronate 5-epimerase